MPMNPRKASMADPVLVYPHNGRGGWPASGTGGTLNLKGELPGAFYRAPASGAPFVMPGRTAYTQLAKNQPIGVNDFAVYQGVRALQSALVVAEIDGLFGPATGEAVRQFQSRQNLVTDGVVGPKTATAIFRPLVVGAAKAIDSGLSRLGLIACGTINWESRFDPGAVGYATPNDLGLGQINGPAHPGLSATDRFNPTIAITFITNLVDDNLRAFPGNERAGIAAYNLGRAGARSWVAAGMPDLYGSTDVKHYIDSVLASI